MDLSDLAHSTILAAKMVRRELICFIKRLIQSLNLDINVNLIWLKNRTSKQQSQITTSYMDVHRLKTDLHNLCKQVTVTSHTDA